MYSFIIMREENPEETRIYISERISQIIENREVGGGSLANCLQKS